MSIQDTADKGAGGGVDFAYDAVAFPMAKAASVIVNMVDNVSRDSQHSCAEEPRLLPFMVESERRTRGRTGRATMASTIRYIQANVGRSYPIGDLARHAGCSRRTLERRFRNVLGTSILSVIQNRRIEEAKRRLATSGDSVTAIARNVGFASSAQFHAVFKRLAGMTPAAFRRAVTRPAGPHPGR